MMRFELKSRKHFHKVFGEYVDLSDTYTFDCLYTVFKLLSIVPEINNPNYSFKLYNREELVAENEKELERAREYARHAEMTEEETKEYIKANTLDYGLVFNGRIECDSNFIRSNSIFRETGDGFEFYVYYDGSWSLIADNEIKKGSSPSKRPYTHIKFPDPNPENQCHEEMQFVNAEKSMAHAIFLLPEY